MKELLARCDTEGATLLPTLKAVLEDGLLQYEGYLLLTSQSKLVSSRARDRFPDKTGFECFVNHLHLDDYVKTGCALVEQAVAFGRELRVAKQRLGVTEDVVYIFAGDTEEMNVRFHVLRPGEQWLDPDIERYQEAVGVEML